VYTLVSAATLGFDLSRLPGGARAAEVLTAGMLADDVLVTAMARQHRSHCVLDDRSTTSRPDAGAVRRARELAASGSNRIIDLTAPTSADLVTQLERRTLGDAASLERLVHGELVVVGQHVDERTAALAREVLADAVLAAYAADALPRDLTGLLPAAYDDAVASSPVAPSVGDLGPQGDDVITVLESLATEPERWRVALAGTVDTSGAWARAMHAACWCAEIAGRTRATALGQLLAVRAMAEGGVTAAQAASGVWNAAAGVVQATILADVLGDAETERLLAPWRAVRATATV